VTNPATSGSQVSELPLTWDLSGAAQRPRPLVDGRRVTAFPRWTCGYGRPDCAPHPRERGEPAAPGSRTNRSGLCRADEHEFRAFTGLTPTRYVEVRRRFLREHPGHTLEGWPLPAD
jgi:hypothetical protein